MSGTGPGGQPSGAPAQSAPVASPAAHPTNGLDDTVHQRHRLGILTITAEARAEFGYLRGALGLTPGNLSRHLTVLEKARLVQVEKGYQGRRPRTWVRITGRGRAALAAESPPLPNWSTAMAAPPRSSPDRLDPSGHRDPRAGPRRRLGRSQPSRTGLRPSMASVGGGIGSATNQDGSCLARRPGFEYGFIKWLCRHREQGKRDE